MNESEKILEKVKDIEKKLWFIEGCLSTIGYKLIDIQMTSKKMENIDERLSSIERSLYALGHCISNHTHYEKKEKSE